MATTYGIDEPTIDSLIAAGAPDEVIEAARSKITPTSNTEEFEIWPENLDSLNFYLLYVQHQWVAVAGMVGIYYSGLNHAGIESAFNLLKIPVRKRKRLYQDMCIIEAAAKPVLNAPLKD